jgi:RsiW-degrading membrane proteinase PrsW (M82 family)
MPLPLTLAVGLLPVIGFLLALIGLDSFKLVSLRRVLALLAAGGLAALASLPANRVASALLNLDATGLVRYVAPVTEELLKGAIVALLIARRRVGFLVDAAIAGFAVGAGFAAVENIHYALTLASPRLGVWLVRGLGTAIMHGGATACMAIMAKTLSDRWGRVTPLAFAPGWLLAILLHSTFNHFFLAPDLSTLALLIGLPLVFLAVFRVSEERTREWLGTGFDTDAELLEIVHAGGVEGSRVGVYLKSLQEMLPPAVVADMLCLLRLRLELSISAKGILLLREAGIARPADPETKEKFAELAFLEREIGKTGLAALHPILNFSDRDLWQLHMLAGR